ncbi:MAG: hypothetical protein LBH74_00255 [Nitrososphaerota archaeon]|jgi:hypothetical protein|uniref:hypothetical protein n=1 Tax=Candidatus Bathycorpusculum sp. TaxID=2994959 RepID=UPI002839F617|nr:hypothetical protein [Candidatus Termitimicrobium sp.]MCL2431385.1 hypothetical protein [Candidatus Termitimicrobium sp.]MDR0492063.1 hypothetical protein [Nitrososphaerota archaeon]
MLFHYRWEEEVTIWLYVKTTDDPKIVGNVVCTFNSTDGEHPGDKYTWVMQEVKSEPNYWEIKGKYAALQNLTEIAVIYRIGDAVVFSEIEDDLAPDFLDPLISKYGFDNVKWIVVCSAQK